MRDYAVEATITFRTVITFGCDDPVDEDSVVDNFYGLGLSEVFGPRGTNEYETVVEKVTVEEI